MFKTPASWLLLTFAFSTAHAPTFNFWRGSVEREQSAETMSAGSAPALRDYAEKGDIKRFGVDERNLPHLDVSVPALFEWDGERTYLANETPYDAEFRTALLTPAEPTFDSYAGARFDYGARRIGSVYGGGRAARGAGNEEADGGIDGASGTGGQGGGHSDVDPGNASAPGNSNAKGPRDANNDPPADSTPIDAPPSDAWPQDPTPPVGDLPPSVLEPVPSTPVPVPAPGSLMLLAMGLAGLRWAGRNKKQKRSAAS